MFPQNCSPFGSSGLRFFCAAVLLLSFATSRGQSQQPCDNIVAEAQKEYDAGRFANTVRLLSLCVKEIPTEQRVGAYRLLAHAYLKEDHVEEARVAIKEIFKLRRDYACDPAQDEQTYCELTQQTKAALPISTREKIFGGWKKWLWYGGGALGVGTAVYLSQLKNEEAKPLPGPPELP